MNKKIIQGPFQTSVLFISAITGSIHIIGLNRAA